jgi:uncharacterized membrane protein YedE/YeeE
MGGVLFGGLLFGTGMAVFGYCPGTGVAACGAGRKDAMVGVLGMLVGALMYVWLFPVHQPALKTFPDWGKVTLPEVTTTSPWLWVVCLILVTSISYYILGSRRSVGKV